LGGILVNREERYEDALQKLSSVSFLLEKLLELDQTCEYEYLRVISNEVKDALDTFSDLQD
jgi:hypothetical protein